MRSNPVRHNRKSTGLKLALKADGRANDIKLILPEYELFE
jgi:hypothetical protein